MSPIEKPRPVHEHRKNEGQVQIGTVHIEPGMQRVNAEGGVYIPRRYTFDTRVGAVAVQIDYEARDGKTMCTAVRISGEPVGAPTLTEIVRQMSKWEELSRRTAMDENDAFGLGAVPFLGGLLTPAPNAPAERTAIAVSKKLQAPKPARGRRPKLTAAYFKDNVADVYLRAHAAGGNTTVAVAGACGVSEDTARNYISRARNDFGYELPPANKETNK